LMVQRYVDFYDLSRGDVETEGRFEQKSVFLPCSYSLKCANWFVISEKSFVAHWAKNLLLFVEIIDQTPADQAAVASIPTVETARKLVLMSGEDASHDIDKGNLEGKLKTLHQINWDFNESAKGKTIHSIHPYPAKFIPEIPLAVIETLKPDRQGVILDPFCGSGVSLVAAQQCGYDAIGIDLNPIACLLSRVKTRSIDVFSLATCADEVISRAKSLLPYCIPDIPNLNHWFNKNAQIGLTRLTTIIRAIEDETLREALLIACSSIIVKVSNQDSDTRYAAVAKAVEEQTVYDLFYKAVRQLIHAKSRQNYLTKNKVTVLNSNVLAVQPETFERRVGLVVTSPPYPNAYEYWLYHKYRMWWLGFDPLAVKEHEIGARSHFFKKNHHTGDDFLHQMSQLFSLLDQVMLPDAFAVFVVGRSIIHGIEYANEELIARAATTHNFTHRTTIVRAMKSSRKSFNLAHARIKSEYIVVVQHH